MVSSRQPANPAPEGPYPVRISLATMNLRLPVERLRPISRHRSCPSSTVPARRVWNVWQRNGFLWVTAIEFSLVFGVLHLLFHLLGYQAYRLVSMELKEELEKSTSKKRR